VVLTSRRFTVPLDHGAPSGESLSVFAREVVAPGRESADLPWMVFLQGGPGYGAPRPVDGGSWVGQALQTHRVLLLDQRGTGLSTPITAAGVAARGSPAEQAAYLRNFRADSIVRDCEHVRRELIGDRPWSILGQSYGGFCALNYLSQAPEGLEAVYITGGVPSITATADDVYRVTYPKCRRKNEQYFARYPEDGPLLRRIARHLEDHDERLPSGDRLTTRRLQMLGLQFGFSDGFETVHYLLEDAFASGDDHLSFVFLKHFEGLIAHDTHPIFSILHEAAYAQGASTNWAAERLRGDYPEFDPRPDGDGPLFLTGEFIYPWMFEEISALAPLKDAAHLLAETEDWPALYDPAVLAKNEVPIAAAVYFHDMYVPTELSLETEARVPNLRTWVTSEYEHNGLRADGPRVLGRLMDMVAGRA
jgi:pimeloyl-ACP methyl ester carboxylesterase